LELWKHQIMFVSSNQARRSLFIITPENLQQRTMVELGELKPAKVQAQQADADPGEQAAGVRPVGDVVTA
jgi:hypothetical protein